MYTKLTHVCRAVLTPKCHQALCWNTQGDLIFKWSSSSNTVAGENQKFVELRLKKKQEFVEPRWEETKKNYPEFARNQEFDGKDWNQHCIISIADIMSDLQPGRHGLSRSSLPNVSAGYPSLLRLSVSMVTRVWRPPALPPLPCLHRPENRSNKININP